MPVYDVLGWTCSTSLLWRRHCSVYLGWPIGVSFRLFPSRNNRVIASLYLHVKGEVWLPLFQFSFGMVSDILQTKEISMDEIRSALCQPIPIPSDSRLGSPLCIRFRPFTKTGSPHFIFWLTSPRKLPTPPPIIQRSTTRRGASNWICCKNKKEKMKYIYNNHLVMV